VGKDLCLINRQGFISVSSHLPQHYVKSISVFSFGLKGYKDN